MNEIRRRPSRCPLRALSVDVHEAFGHHGQDLGRVEAAEALLGDAITAIAFLTFLERFAARWQRHRGDHQWSVRKPVGLETRSSASQLSVDSRYPLSTARTTFPSSRRAVITTSLAALCSCSPALTSMPSAQTYTGFAGEHGCFKAKREKLEPVVHDPYADYGRCERDRTKAGKAIVSVGGHLREKSKSLFAVTNHGAPHGPADPPLD